jgi:hypothetical protein
MTMPRGIGMGLDIVLSWPIAIPGIGLPCAPSMAGVRHATP